MMSFISGGVKVNCGCAQVLYNTTMYSMYRLFSACADISAVAEKDTAAAALLGRANFDCQFAGISVVYSSICLLSTFECFPALASPPSLLDRDGLGKRLVMRFSISQGSLRRELSLTHQKLGGLTIKRTERRQPDCLVLARYTISKIGGGGHHTSQFQMPLNV